MNHSSSGLGGLGRALRLLYEPKLATPHPIYNTACSVFKMRPPTKMREKMKKLQQMQNTFNQKMCKKLQTLKTKFQQERKTHIQLEEADLQNIHQLQSQIKNQQKRINSAHNKIADQEDLLALVLDQACASSFRKEGGCRGIKSKEQVTD